MIILIHNYIRIPFEVSKSATCLDLRQATTRLCRKMKRYNFTAVVTNIQVQFSHSLYQLTVSTVKITLYVFIYIYIQLIA
jgi:hypothetical protein